MLSNRIILVCFLTIFMFNMVSYNLMADENDNPQSKQPLDPSSLEMRQNTLEKNIDKLYTFMIVIPGVAALLVVILQISSVLTQNADRKIVRDRFDREKQTADIVDSVMSSVNQLLAFQAAQAEKQKLLIEKFDPSRGIELIKNKAIEIRKPGNLTRYNLHDYHDELKDLANRMKSMEDLYNIADFKQSINCLHIRGLAAHLENQIQDANKYFREVSQMILTEEGKKEKDEAIEPVSLFYRGILLKNIGSLLESEDCFNEALDKWPASNREVLARIELAEVIALKNKYKGENPRLKDAFDKIDKMFEDNTQGVKPLAPRQIQNLRSQKMRLYLLDGNYSFKAERFEEAISKYEKIVEMDPKNIFGNLSIGIALLKNQNQEEGRLKLKETYKLIVTSDRLITHPEPRGRILLLGSAIIAGRLCGAHNSELRELRDINELHVDFLREIEDLRKINIRAGAQFMIFSPLSKELCNLIEFRNHVDNPIAYI
ncbi:hypothetical protein L0Z72_16635 [candidate division KSB1 bacterium]|nr:hypothetical protein [candidate division KSB1 bacterium]